MRSVFYRLIFAGVALCCGAALWAQDYAANASATSPSGVYSSAPGGATVKSPTTLNVEEPERPSAKPPEKKPELPPEPPTEFQMLAADSAGRMPAIFGSELFRRSFAGFASNEDAAAPADYLLGPGDQVIVNLWGSVSLHAQLTVNREGRVYVPRVGEIAVAGVRLDRLESRLRSEIDHVYRNYELSASIGRLRSIRVFVTGQARQPGSYTLSSLSTLVTALFAAGGPSSHGSLRHIELRREGRLVVDFDLYDLLLRGDASKSVALQPGDVINILPVGPQVAMVGSLNAPAVYELRGAEETLGDALAMAGGLNSVADGGRLTIERIDDRRSRSVAEFALDEHGRAQNVKDGDIVRVFAIVPRFDNAITLRGNVANPGRYAWRPGMRVRDLIPNKESLLTRDYWRQQNCMVDGRMTQYAISRRPRAVDAAPTPSWTGSASLLNGAGSATSPDASGPASPTNASGLRAQAAGRGANVPTSGRIVDGDCVYLENQAPEGVDAQASANVNADELLRENRSNATAVNWEYASIQRRSAVDLSTQLIPFSLGKAVLENDAASNVELQPGDVVTVFSQGDLAVAQEKTAKYVRVEGEVHFPGVYRVENGDTLRSLLRRAGGLTNNAYPYAAYFTRESARLEQQKAIVKIADEMEAQIHQKSMAQTKSDMNNSASNAMLEQSQMALVRSLRETKATGRVVLALKPGDEGVEQFPEIVLENGDSILVPARSNTVSVVGSVYTQSSFLYRQGMTVKAYLRQAGGGTASADRKHVLLVRADGSVIGGHGGVSLWSGGVRDLRVLPGDTIVLPARLDSTGFSQVVREWVSVAAQGAIAAAVITK